MNHLRDRLKKQGGFTMVELLIVVAIIAILIAISIPMFNAALERAREATDAANERAAKAEILTCYMLGTDINGVAGGTPIDPTKTYSYNAGTGKLEAETPTSTLAYGKCSDHKGGFVQVSINATTNVVTVKWKVGSTEVTNLCMDKVSNK